MSIITYLSANGNTATEQNYQVVLEAYFNPETGLTDPGTWRTLGKRIRTSQVKMCHSMIPQGFLEQETIDDTFVILLLSMKTPSRTNANRHTLIGFAALEYDSDHPDELYLNALCGNTDVRNRTRDRVSPGSILMAQIDWMAREMGFSIIKLSALAYVINYYRRLGFRHVNHCGELTGDASGAPIEADSGLHDSASRFSSNRFKSDDELEQIFLIEQAKQTIMLGNDREKLDYLVSNLNKLFASRGIHFRNEDGRIIPLNEDEDIDENLQALLYSADTGTADFMNMLRMKGFAVECVGKSQTSRGGVHKNEDGELVMSCESDGFTMRKCLSAFPPPPESTMPGRGKYNPHIIHSMAGGNRRTRRTRKSVPWKGWAKQSPSMRQRHTMKKRCGKKCFLGPKVSFPVCKKNTCQVSSKGLWAAYVRAKEWGKPRRSYRGKARPRHRRSVYTRVANKAKKELKKRGFKVGASTKKRGRRSRRHSRRR